MATIMLIPGAGGQSWFWHRVVPRLAARGHEPIAVDLPDGDLAATTDRVVAAIPRRSPASRADDLVLVAQSLGGFVAPLVCARRPVRHLVLVNAMVPAPGETAGEWWDATGQPAARAADAARVGRAPDAEFDVVADFFHDVPPEITAEAMAAPPAPPSDALFADPWPLAAWPDVPTSFLAARDDRLFPLEFQRRVVAERLGIDVREMPGGHLNSLSEPDALAEAIDEEISR